MNENEKLAEQAKLIADMVTTVLRLKGIENASVTHVESNPESQSLHLYGNTYEVESGLWFVITITDDLGNLRTISIPVFNGDTHSKIKSRIEAAL